MLVTTGVVLASVLQAQKPPPGTVVQELVGKRLDEAVRDKAPAFWGAVLAAVQGEVVLAKGYGFADRQKIPLGPHSLFDLSGASQLLTRTLVLRLVDDRRLKLDDPVQKHLLDWPDSHAAITIDHLLCHTSGLPDEAPWGPGGAQASRPAMLAIGRTKLLAAPGKAVHYSSLNPVLLALLVEQVTQQRFERALVDRCLKPLGMATAGPCNGRFDGKLVTARGGKTGEPGAPATAFDLNWVHRGARGVLASPLDVHAMLLAWTGGKVLDAAQLDVLWRPIAGGDPFAVTRSGGADSLLRIAAQGNGYRVRITLHEPTRNWLVLLGDEQGSLDGLEKALLAELAAQRAPAPVVAADPAPGPRPAEPAEAPVTPADAQRFAGTFQLAGARGGFVVEPAGAGLVLRGSGLEAAARVAAGRWPPADEALLRRTEDRGLAVLERLALGDATVLGEAFADEAGAAAASERIAEWLAVDGPRRAIELVGSQRIDGAMHSWFALVGARGTRRIHAVWRDDRAFATFDLDRGPAPFTVPLSIVRADCATAKAIDGTPLKVTIEGVAPHRVLVVEDQSPGAAGLVEGHELVGSRR